MNEASALTDDPGVGGAADPTSCKVNSPPAANNQSVTAAEDTQAGPISVTKNPADGPEVTHFRVSAIKGGRLYMPDGVTQIRGGTFVPFASVGAGLRFTPELNYTGPAGFTVQAATGPAPSALGGGTDTSNVTITPVNDRPTLGPLNNRFRLEDSAGEIITLTDISAGGNESQTLSVTATSSNPAIVPDPIVTYTSPNSTGTLSYTPVANANGTAIITVTVNDGGGGTESFSRSFSVNLTPVNDAPSFTKGANQVVAEGSGPRSVSNWAMAISAGPPNESSQALAFIVTNSNPALFSAQPAVSPTGTLTFTPGANASGAATVSVKLKDSAGALNGGQDTSVTQTFSVTVNPINDAPVNTVPGAQAVVRNGTLVFSAANSRTISIADVDAGSAQIRVALSCSKGSVTLGTTAGLTFSTGDGAADTTVIFMGTLANINAALDGLQFKPTANYTGPAALRVIANDLGANGAGGALTDTDTIKIAVTNPALAFLAGRWS